VRATVGDDVRAKTLHQQRGYRFPEFLLSLFFILGGAAVVSYEQLQLMPRVFLIRRCGVS